jgi:hypothetical protein
MEIYGRESDYISLNLHRTYDSVHGGEVKIIVQGL